MTQVNVTDAPIGGYAELQQAQGWTDEQIIAFIMDTAQVDADYAAFMLAISKGEIDGDTEEVTAEEVSATPHA